MDHITKLISMIERTHLQYRNAAFQQLGIKGYQYSYLIQICRCPGISQEQLTKQIHLDKSNVARSLAQLEEAGFLTRQADPSDQRRWQIFPTEKATAILPAILETLSKQRAFMLEPFTDEEQLQFQKYLRLLYERADELLRQVTL